MKLKYIIYGMIFFGCQLTHHAYARLFDVFVEPQGLATLDGKMVKDHDFLYISQAAPTYGWVRQLIAQLFNIDADWKNFTIKFFDHKTEKFFYLKPYIENLSLKEREGFFSNLVSVLGAKGVPSLLIAKRRPEEIKSVNPKPHVYKKQIPQLTFTKDELVSEDENLGWDFDETLVGESDPVLVEKLKMIGEKYQ